MPLVRHFDKIAPKYRQLRPADLSPIAYVSQLLDNTTALHGLELGCGTGRYSQLLLNYLPKLFLICCDYSNAMLDELKRKLKTRGKPRFVVLEKKAEELSFHKNTFDVIFSFNAIHHLDMSKIVPRAEKWIRSGGWIFLYTRLPSQNRSSVWGQYFPKFAKKESRLYTKDQLIGLFHQSSRLRLIGIREFRHQRKATLKDLLNRADNAYYSTFCFYTPSEYKIARGQFIKNILERYNDSENISWTDRNSLAIVRKAAT